MRGSNVYCNDTFCKDGRFILFEKNMKTLRKGRKACTIKKGNCRRSIDLFRGRLLSFSI